MEELENALKQYNMGDEKTIQEIIAEVDTDHVWFPFYYMITIVLLLVFAIKHIKICVCSP